MAQNPRDGSRPAGGTPVQRTHFPVAPPDVQVIVITGLFVVSFLYFGGQYALSAALHDAADGRDLVFAAFVGLMVLWRALNAVRGYVLETGGPDGPELVIQQWMPLRRLAVPLARLRSADAGATVLGITNTNIFSLGGLFGWAGASQVRNLGSVLVYANSRRRVVLLELAPRADGRYQKSDGSEPRGPAVLVSPRDPAALAAALAPLRTAPARLVVGDLSPEAGTPPATAPAAAARSTAPARAAAVRPSPKKKR